MIEVWAPRARSVALHRPGGHDLELTAREGGWFAADVELKDGDEYGFVLDGSGQVRPDPRSRRQPRGVHELSAWFDADAHDFDLAHAGQPRNRLLTRTDWNRTDRAARLATVRSAASLSSWRDRGETTWSNRATSRSAAAPNWRR